jgi:hypothetical protein
MFAITNGYRRVKARDLGVFDAFFDAFSVGDITVERIMIRLYSLIDSIRVLGRQVSRTCVVTK